MFQTPSSKPDSRFLYNRIDKIDGGVKGKKVFCVSKVIMSLLTAKLKCPHGDGKDINGAEAVTEVAFDEDGGG
jgi:hypothetical protein